MKVSNGESLLSILMVANGSLVLRSPDRWQLQMAFDSARLNGIAALGACTMRSVYAGGEAESARIPIGSIPARQFVARGSSRRGVL